MRKFAIIAGLLLIPAITIAGTVTIDFGGAPIVITTTARQDARLATLAAKHSITVNKAIEILLTKIVVHEVRQIAEEEASSACKSFNALPAAAQSAITAQLGGKSPCIN